MTPLPYHRLVLARRRPGWWTPLLVGLAGAALYAALLVFVIAVALVVALFAPEAMTGVLSMTEDAAFDLTDPLLVAVLLGTIALMLPAYLLASLIVNGRPLGFVSSVAGRLRWGWMLGCAAIATVIALALTALSALLPADESADLGGVVAPAQNPQLLATLVVLLLIVPLQAAAEEYVFRGYLQQAIGRWLRHPLFAILLPVPLFVLGHLYDPLGQLSVGLFAVAAGWLTWRTGGLEAAIALHVVNNLLAFLLGLAGLSDVNAKSPGIASAVWSAVVLVGYVVVVEWAFRRAGLARTMLLLPPADRPAPTVAATPPGAAAQS